MTLKEKGRLSNSQIIDKYYPSNSINTSLNGDIINEFRKHRNCRRVAVYVSLKRLEEKGLVEIHRWRNNSVTLTEED